MSLSNHTSCLGTDQESQRDSYQKLPSSITTNHYSRQNTSIGTDNMEHHGQPTSYFQNPFILSDNQRYSGRSLQKMIPLSSESSMSSGVESSPTITNSLSDLDGSSGLNKTKETEDLIITKDVPIPSLVLQSDMNSGLKTYPIAWLLLFAVVAIRAAVAIFSNTFSPVPSVTADFMGISLSSVNWLYNTTVICYIIASFLTSYIYQKIGVKWSVSNINHYCLGKSIAQRSFYS